MDYLLSEPLGKPETFYTYCQTFSQKLPDILETIQMTKIQARKTNVGNRLREDIDIGAVTDFNTTGSCI